MPDLNIIGLVGEVGVDHCINVLAALSHSCGLIIRRAQLNEAASLAGLIILGPDTKLNSPFKSLACPSIRVITCDAGTVAATVRFNAGNNSPIPFRGQSLLADSARPADPQELTGAVVATADGRPVWITSTERGLRHDVCWVPLPWVQKSDCVFEHLNSRRFMNLLPLLEWLRSVSGWQEWQQPPLSACFMFDDPNLHSQRYGFVRFAQLAAEGRSGHYHASFATVPFDGYYVNGAAARIFRDNPQTLSFLIHGNNHTYRELAGRQTLEYQSALMRQAVLRTGQLERKSGVALARVMAPPHGVCSASMMAAMLAAGLEAVCVSHGSVQTGNPGADWTVSLGTLPATVVAGFPVIPRFGLEPDSKNNILLAVYLHQPIIPTSHHWDLAEGTEILSAAARFINSLGPVRWGDMTSIVRNNYRSRVRGQVMRIHTFSRITTIRIPEGITELQVEVPWLNPVSEMIEIRGSGNAGQHPPRILPPNDLRAVVVPGKSIDLVVLRNPNNGELPPELPRTTFGAMTRRVLAELRDRSMPYVPRRFVRR